MKASTLRIFLSVHTWVGLVSGMALFIAFYAGAISIFVHELQEWEQPVRVMPSREDALQQAQRLVDDALRERPQISHGFTLTLPGEHGTKPWLYWYDAASDTPYRIESSATKQATEQRPARAGFVEFIYDLHFTAGLPRRVGSYLFGVVCVLYGLALVSGVVLYAPAFLKDLFALRLGRNLKRFWQDAHNVVGMLSLPFHIIFAWTGAVLTIGFLLLAPFQFLVFDGKLLTVLEQDFDVAPHVEPAGVSASMLSVGELVQRAEQSLPGLSVESLFYHDAGDANVQVTASGELAQGRLNRIGHVAMNGTNGDIINALAPSDYAPGRAMLGALQALHYGDFGHMTVKWLYFLLGLAGAFLFYSGNLLWIEARRKRRQVEQPRRTRIMAGLTLGVCLGCVAGVSAVFLAAVWLPAGWIAASYFSVFFGAMIWALLRPPARAAHELLWLSALLSAMIPVAGWMGSGEHLLMALWQGHWHRFLIDATALVMAIAFWRMAVATLSRARSGDPNSVWALP